MDKKAIDSALSRKNRRQLLLYFADCSEPQRTNEIGEIVTFKYNLKFINRQALLFNLHKLEKAGLLEVEKQTIEFKEKKERKKMQDRKVFKWKISSLGLQTLKNRYGLGLK